MEETWTHEAALEPFAGPKLKLNFVSENEPEQTNISSPSTSSVSSADAVDSKFGGQILRFGPPKSYSPACPDTKSCERVDMSDPFAVRMNFKRAYLDKLTSSPASQLRAAAYALKYREQDEDLHSCILEQLDACNINLRANIMFFIESLCDLAKREGHLEYVRNVERDMPKIIDLVAPGTRAGATNIKVVRKVLNGLQEKSILQPSQVQNLFSTLASREVSALKDIANPVDNMHLDRADGIHDLDEKDVEQRMEEDRERHKRLREDTWAVDPDTELEQLWESGRAGLTAKLLQDCKDDAKARKLAIELDKMNYQQGDTPMAGT